MTIDRARLFWRLVAGYVELQADAGLLGEWDTRHAWPHGDAAALVARAEELEAKLPTELSTTASDPRFCPCGSGQALGRCHGGLLDEIRSLRQRAHDAEEAFWNDNAGRPCCGTLKTCRLRDRTPMIFISRTQRLPSWPDATAR